MPDTYPESPASPGDGQVITFYSYKGGTGRTMALANVAWILAANGKRVLVADWDLESPGLHRFFHPFLPEEQVRDASGVIDLIRQYAAAAGAAAVGEAEARAAADAESEPEATAEVGEEADHGESERLIAEMARIQPHALEVSWEHFPPGGSLQFLSAGRQNLNYAAALAALDWDNFYSTLRGGEFLDAVRADMKQNYDYVLIDSRTGLSDIAGICTIQLPDVLVDCFTLSIQGIEGAAEVAKQVEASRRNIRILPVPMRVDQAEKEKVDAGHAEAVRLFAGMPAGMSPAKRSEYWAAVEVPYRAFYAYEETLAVFGDPPGSLSSMLASFERLTAQITDGVVTGLPPIDERHRNRAKLMFTRQTRTINDEVTVAFCTQDQVWGEWISEVIRSAGIPVKERQLDDSLQSGPGQGTGRTLTVVSALYLARYRSLIEKADVPTLAVYVTSARPPVEFYKAESAVIAGVSEIDAIEQLQKLIGAGNWRAAETPSVHRVRYPGNEPAINTAPVANVRFTGREEDLRELRELLSESGASGVPVALQGIGGVGKTQIAIEYVHRFKTDYDVIWWLDCQQPQFIDASLADLGAKMRDALGLTVPATTNVTEVANAVLELLHQGKDVSRWLLVFDNAEDIDAVQPYLPKSGGDILITSRLGDWAERAHERQLDVFSRDESVAHLRKRIPSISRADANEVAELLGDFPLAVATAGAWLRETGTAVASYVRELERRAPEALSYKHLDEYPKTLAETWELSLDRLMSRSPAAARLFELCSVMASNIALELLQSQAVADLLKPLDPGLSDSLIIGKLVHEIDRLALIKLDHSTDQIRIHRLLQLVVRDRMTEDQLAATEHEVHQLLAAARPSRGVDNQETWDRYRMIWPHLDFSRAVTSTSESVMQLLTDRLRYLWLRHDLERGLQLATDVESAWRQTLAQAADEATAEALRRELLYLRSAQANILRDLDRFLEAKAIDESVLPEQGRLLGEIHPRTLATAGGLAADLRAAGQYREALAMDEATYRLWTEHYGDGIWQSLRAANNLGLSYRLTGDVTTALRIHEETWERYAVSLGPLHRQTLIAAFNVVRDMIDAGQYADAALRMEGFLTSAVSTHGADSVEAMKGTVLLAIAQRSAGQPAEAEDLFEAALSLSDRLGGRTTTDALAARLSHAVNLLALAEPALAGQEIRQVNQILDRRLGPAHPQALICQLDLACALSDDDPVQALENARSAAGGLALALGETHPHTLAASSVAGGLLAEAGELAQAEEIEALVADAMSRTLGRNHPDTLRSRANLLITRQALNVPDAAEELRRTVSDVARVLGADHPHVKELSAGHRLMHTLDPQPF
ncbi:MAG TPA: FxSxx-COOH system tetratricopeptide repeat protein [Streptosporangiaceae bacterium]|jgi:tetratricopeptide (TPR) repeat protein|nr:FxSxx-COOH system tetratricopeptide repeat protein [Streptosporangiaceae bacterium]